MWMSSETERSGTPLASRNGCGTTFGDHLALFVPGPAASAGELVLPKTSHTIDRPSFTVPASRQTPGRFR